MKKKRPANEPQIEFSSQSGLWHDSGIGTLCIGCKSCPEFAICGGLRTNIRIFDCTSLCSCADRSQCDTVCRLNARTFVERFREIDGFEFESIPRVDPVVVRDLPDVVPVVFHRSSRERRLQEPAVALPLRELIDLRAGQLVALTREQLAERFLIDPGSRIVVSGVAKDGFLEGWWRYPHRGKLIEAMKVLDIDLITVPNFSLLIDVPRWDNLHAMKRIASAWAEFAGAGLPTALHVNARTEHDYARWAEFVRTREEISFLAFEFGTAAGWPARIDWHVARLCELARSVGRPIPIAIRGGVTHLRPLREAFERVIFIDTDSFPRTIKRRKADLAEAGRLRWHTALTPAGAQLDELLAWNIHAVATWVRSGGPGPRCRSSLPSHHRGAPDRDDEARQRSLL
jgi:hypothetical protein